MERFSFAPEVAFAPRGDLLDHVSLAPLTPSSAEGALVQAVILRFEPGGRLRRHPAASPQILAVLEGSGEVSGANGVDEPIGAGEAVFLHEGEDHEMKSEAGLTALIIEGEHVDRSLAVRSVWAEGLWRRPSLPPKGATTSASVLKPG